MCDAEVNVNASEQMTTPLQKHMFTRKEDLNGGHSGRRV